jgi:hypothetical protein
MQSKRLLQTKANAYMAHDPGLLFQEAKYFKWLLILDTNKSNIMMHQMCTQRLKVVDFSIQSIEDASMPVRLKLFINMFGQNSGKL